MFEMTLLTGLLIAGVVIVLLLSGVAGLLHWQLYLRKKKNQQRLDALEMQKEKHRKEAATSLRIIAKSYLSEQVELAEAGIRISRILDTIELNEIQRSPYKVFDQINEKLKHIPILQEWKSLPKKEKWRHTKTIARVEAEYKDFALDAAKQLTSFEVISAEHYPA